MGVPTFYRWLCTKYPKVVKDAVEEREVLCGDEFVPADLNDKNPNGIEFDNLYIDMNGVVHPCCHPEDGSTPSNETEMFQNVMDYLDRIVSIVRPRKVIYLALDGVAPRAKMNQQRSRRFKAALQADTAEEVYHSLKQDFEAEGLTILPQVVRWDSNVITPGTPFMDRLAQVIRYYIHSRLTHNSYWKNLAIIFSDSNIPGEGEHKIMQYVRTQRALPGYDPNTTHCIHGMDADLIMLSLATHEPHFYIVREVVMDNNASDSISCANCLRPGHLVATCRMPLRPGVVLEAKKDPEPQQSTPMTFKSTWKPLQFLQIPILREYLQAEFNFQPQDLLIQDATGNVRRVPSNIERHIDDFVFMCFLVGNDFLPHLPSLSIQKGSIDQMTTLYKCVYPRMGQYLTNPEGKLNLDAVVTFIDFIGKVEPEVLRYDHDRRERMKRNQVHRSQSQPPPENRNPMEDEEPKPPTRTVPVVDVKRKRPGEDENSLSTLSEGETEGSSLDNPVVSLTCALATTRGDIDRWREELKKRLLSRSENPDPVDDIGLGSDNPQDYRLRYYAKKFHLTNPEEKEIEEYASNIATHFVRGLQWVLQYYYQSTPSWDWYFPYHHAPLAVDLHKYGFNNRRVLDQDFTPGEPLTPMEQLMANLPPRSSGFLPPKLAELMTDPKSPLIDFYPTKFHQDQDGKKYEWQWVALLPFIDPNRLKKYARERFGTLTEEEAQRNGLSVDLLCVAKSHPLSQLLDRQVGKDECWDSTFPSLQGKLASSTLPSTLKVACGKSVLRPRQLPSDGFKPTIATWSVAGFKHIFGVNHKPFPIPGAKPPPVALTDADRQIEDSGPGNKFNSKVAKRMILQIVGGIHYERFREKAVRAQEDFAADYVGYGHRRGTSNQRTYQQGGHQYSRNERSASYGPGDRPRINEFNQGRQQAFSRPAYGAPYGAPPGESSISGGFNKGYQRNDYRLDHQVPPPPANDFFNRLNSVQEPVAEVRYGPVRQRGRDMDRGQDMDRGDRGRYRGRAFGRGK